MEENREIPVCLECYNTEPPPLAARCNRCGGRIEMVQPGILIEVLKRELLLTRQQLMMLSSQLQWHMRHANEQREMLSRAVAFLTAEVDVTGPLGLGDMETLEQLKHIPDILRSRDNQEQGIDALKKGTATEILFKDGTKALATPISIRPDVVKFALAMEERLAANDWKGYPKTHPDSPPIDFFVDKLGEEVNELVQAVEENRREQTPHGILPEAADVANIAMFIAKVTRAL